MCLMCPSCGKAAKPAGVCRRVGGGEGRAPVKRLALDLAAGCDSSKFPSSPQVSQVPALLRRGGWRRGDPSLDRGGYGVTGADQPIFRRQGWSKGLPLLQLVGRGRGVEGERQLYSTVGVLRLSCRCGKVLAALHCVCIFALRCGAVRCVCRFRGPSMTRGELAVSVHVESRSAQEKQNCCFCPAMGFAFAIMVEVIHAAAVCRELTRQE